MRRYGFSGIPVRHHAWTETARRLTTLPVGSQFPPNRHALKHKIESYRTSQKRESLYLHVAEYTKTRQPSPNRKCITRDYLFTQRPAYLLARTLSGMDTTSCAPSVALGDHVVGIIDNVERTLKISVNFDTEPDSLS